jgi:hypothetical protein
MAFGEAHEEGRNNVRVARWHDGVQVTEQNGQFGVHVGRWQELEG